MVAFERVLPREGDNPLRLVDRQPVIAPNPNIVFDRASEALAPVVELTHADADSANHPAPWQLGLVGLGPDETDQFVPRVIGNPLAL